jgi:hypothetical protein
MRILHVYYPWGQVASIEFDGTEESGNTLEANIAVCQQRGWRYEVQ